MIDWNRALELREEMGEDGFDEVLELFLSEVEEALDSLDAATGAAETYEAALHFLKGAALNLGFADLATLCSKGESAAAKGDLGIVAPAEVKDIYDLSKTTFLKELPARAAA